MPEAMRGLRLWWAIGRFELTVVVVASLGLVAAAAFVAGSLNAQAPSPDCLRTYLVGGPESAELRGCPSPRAFFELQASLGGIVQTGMSVLPFFAGALIGSQTVAREIEHNSASLAWSLSLSRRRWLAEQVAFAALLLVGLMTMAAIASVIVEQAAYPWLPATESFSHYGAHGLLVVARVIPVLLIGVLVGAVVGRALPALLVSSLACAVLVAMLLLTKPYGQPLEVLAEADTAQDLQASLTVTERYRAPTGELVGLEAALAASPHDPRSDAAVEWVFGHYERVVLGIPGQRLLEVQVREVAILAGVSVIAGLLALVVVERRRPY